MSGGWGGAREGAGRKSAGYEKPAEQVELDRVRADHERVKLEQRAFKLAVEQDLYVLRADVAQASATLLAVLAQGVYSLPDSLERTAGLSAEQRQRCEGVIDSVMAALSASLKALAEPGKESAE